MINTILFDLDGTLLSFDHQEFEKTYFGLLARDFHGIIEPKKLIDLIWSSTKVMIMNTEKRTNEEVFFSDLKTKIGDDYDHYLSKFEHYYEHTFDGVKAITNPVTEMIEAVQLLKAKNYNLIIATNPLFPKLAIDKRIGWAGMDRDDFKYVTSFEKNHFCKPQPDFYKEVLEVNGVQADECMMVGNDAQEDMIAGKLEVKTYLINNHIIDRNNGDYVADYESGYDGFLEFVKGVPEV